MKTKIRFCSPVAPLGQTRRIDMEKEYSPFYWHNKALREHPEYQNEGMVDCLREEMLMNMPIAPDAEQVYQGSEQPEEPWSKKQWTIVNQLRGMVQFLYLKETERRANASKRRHKDNINK